MGKKIGGGGRGRRREGERDGGGGGGGREKSGVYICMNTCVYRDICTPGRSSLRTALCIYVHTDTHLYIVRNIHTCVPTQPTPARACCRAPSQRRPSTQPLSAALPKDPTATASGIYERGKYRCAVKRGEEKEGREKMDV